MTERLYHKPQRNPLCKQQRCAGVAEIVESVAGDTGVSKNTLETMGHRRSGQWRAILKREQEIPVFPCVSEYQTASCRS
jgi:hypothetical protein